MISPYLKYLTNQCKNISNQTLAAAVLFLFFFLLVSAASATYAFFLSMDTKINAITVGENTTKIEESFIPPQKIDQDECYTKTVAVKNLGSVPCYIRVFAEFSDPKQAAALTADFNESDWTAKQPDGYYYYKKLLPAGQITTPLFTSLSAKQSLSAFEMLVYSDSIQVGTFSDPLSAFQSLMGGGIEKK